MERAKGYMEDLKDGEEGRRNNTWDSNGRTRARFSPWGPVGAGDLVAGTGTSSSHRSSEGLVALQTSGIANEKLFERLLAGSGSWGFWGSRHCWMEGRLSGEKDSCTSGEAPNVKDSSIGILRREGCRSQEWPRQLDDQSEKCLMGWAGSFKSEIDQKARHKPRTECSGAYVVWSLLCTVYARCQTTGTGDLEHLRIDAVQFYACSYALHTQWVLHVGNLKADITGSVH